MKVELLTSFYKDLDKINLQSVKKNIERIVVEVENTLEINRIHNIKKLSGFKSAYRIRIGDFRIGIFIEGNVQLARVVHRKDIYRQFP